MSRFIWVASLNLGVWQTKEEGTPAASCIESGNHGATGSSLYKNQGRRKKTDQSQQEQVHNSTDTKIKKYKNHKCLKDVLLESIGFK